MIEDGQSVRDDREWPGEAPAEGRGEDAIGRIFARTRQELGYDLDTVAAELRIRRPSGSHRRGRYESARYPPMP